MNLNDKIKKHELLVEELNKDVDNLLSEGIGIIPIIKLMIKGKKYIPKLAAATALKKAGDVLMDKEEELKTSKLEGDIEKLTSDIQKLESLMAQLELKKEQQLPFRKIVIEFKKKVELDVQKMKSPEFQRNLVSTMYFTVVDINENEKYLILKTKGYSKIDDSLFFRLDYKTLDIYKEQKGDVNLIYSRYNNPIVNPVEGEKEDCFYRIVEMK
jgi:hypothetical protein